MQQEQGSVDIKRVHVRQPCRVATIRREEFLAELPSVVSVELPQEALGVRHLCELRRQDGDLLTLRGLKLAGRPVLLALGTKVRLGLGRQDGWAEAEGIVVAWAAQGETGQMIVRCQPEGKLLQRRKEPRIRREFPVTCTAAKREEAHGNTIDVSSTGMCVYLNVPLTDAQSLVLNLSENEQAPINLEGRVVWSRPAADASEGCWAGLSLRAPAAASARRYKSLIRKVQKETQP